MGVDGKPWTGNSLMAVDDAVREKTRTIEFVVMNTCGIAMSFFCSASPAPMKAQNKEFKAKENTDMSMSKLTDGAFCRWQSYSVTNDTTNMNHVFQPVRPSQVPTKRLRFNNR